MLMGKRPRPPIIKRTTSMIEFTLDPLLNYQQQPFDPSVNAQHQLTRRKSADFVQTAHFLRACSLCERQLIPGHDIYMYKGDSAFCSLDCREKQMNQDEKCTRKKITTNSATTAITTTAVARGKGSEAPLPQARP